MPQFTLTWTIDAEGTDALDAARRIATDYFSAQIAQGRPDTACVFELTEKATGQVTKIDLTEHRMHLECCHADTCLSSYWSGHHLAHIQVPVYNGMSFETLKDSLRRELNEGAVAGAEYPGTHNDQWYAAAVAAVNAMTLKEGANPAYLFTDLEPTEDEEAESVYAFFVFREIDAPDEEDDDEGPAEDEADPTCSEFRP